MRRLFEIIEQWLTASRLPDPRARDRHRQRNGGPRVHVSQSPQRNKPFPYRSIAGPFPRNLLERANYSVPRKALQRGDRPEPIGRLEFAADGTFFSRNWAVCRVHAGPKAAGGTQLQERTHFAASAGAKENPASDPVRHCRRRGPRIGKARSSRRRFRPRLCTTALTVLRIGCRASARGRRLGRWAENGSEVKFGKEMSADMRGHRTRGSYQVDVADAWPGKRSRVAEEVIRRRAIEL